MEWQHPEALYWILPACAGWIVVALYSDHRRQRARRAFVAQSMWSRILPAESRLRLWTKLALRELAIVMGLVALAGPRFGTQYEHVVPRGSDLYVLIDVSRSMLADDVPPSRLGRAKSDVSSLLNRLEGERVGLIAFAGQAVVKCPLTVDYDSFRRALEELDPNSAPRGGTAIGDAIRKALEVFHAKADRDQAVLLITDGDDQQSYPLEAAATAAERNVTIFAVGLGDAERGARVPQKGNTKTFMEYQGEQVWSKLDGSLLQQIALKTSGVYVPAGTRSYDLGELYANHLQGRRGSDSAKQQRIRRSEQFQLFLAIALVALLIDLCLPMYRRNSALIENDESSGEPKQPRKSRSRRVKSPLVVCFTTALLCLKASEGMCIAAEPHTAVRDGLRFYSQEQYDKAQEQFAAATESLNQQKSPAAAVAAFDEACAFHRQGEVEKAHNAYLRAGLSLDRSIATSAHFNLGNLSAEQARKRAGDNPVTVPAEQRQEIIDSLMQAIVAYRHCLELNPDHAQARRNLELVRQWVKYYSDKWREHDRQKRRDESNLIQFLEFVIQTQRSLRESVEHLRKNATSDMFAELKRAQDELREEIPTLREKIASELNPPSAQGSPAAPAADTRELEEGISLLQGWADAASDKMSLASRRLSAKEPTRAVTEQQAAVEELDKIWDAVIPFLPLLQRELAEQTNIARTLAPASKDDETSPSESNDDNSPNSIEAQPAGVTGKKGADPQASSLQIADDNLVKLAEAQEQALKKTRLLAPKAQAELERLENAPPQTPEQDEKSGSGNAGQQADPELAKAGFAKAIELAPKAVEQMEAAVKSLRQKDRPAATEQTEEARKILEEILQAQPKNEPQQDQKYQDQQKDDKQQQQPENKSDDEKKKDEQKPDDQKPESDKKEGGKKPQPQVSQDRIEEALRKVRERQQEKRERDRRLKGQAVGRSPVDKDW